MGAPSDCTRCPALCQHRFNVVNGKGRSDGIAFVGQSPRFYEDQDGVPFAGRPNQLLDLLIQKANIPRVAVFKTVAVRCMAPGSRKPKKDEIVACRDYLIEELRERNPRCIVTLGDTALQSLYAIGQGTGAYAEALASWENECTNIIVDHAKELSDWSELEKKERGPKPKRPKLPLKPRPTKDEVVTISSVAGHTLVQHDTGIPMIATYNPLFISMGKWQYAELVIAHLAKARRIYENA